MSNFGFLKDYMQFKMFADAAIEAEKVLNTSPAMSAVGSRKAFELAVKWIYSADRTMGNPVGTLQNLIHRPEFVGFVDSKILRRAQALIRLGNEGVHTDADITRDMAIESLRILFSFIKWIDYTYGMSYDPDREFDPSAIPTEHVKLDYESIRRTESLLQQREAEIEELNKRVQELSEQYTAEREKNQREREYVPEDISEFATRKIYIDIDLRGQGWIFDGPNANVFEEFEVDGMEGNPGQKGYVDYVLFGKDGLPLAVVEAKKSSADPNKGRTQAMLYADCLERRYKRRPMMFTTNGFETYFWDDVMCPQRQVSGVFSRSDLQRLMNRRQRRIQIIGVLIIVKPDHGKLLRNPDSRLDRRFQHPHGNVVIPADRTARYHVRWDLTVLPCSVHLQKHFLSIIYFFVTSSRALDLSVVSLSGEDVPICKSCFPELMVHVCCQYKVRLLIYQIINHQIEWQRLRFNPVQIRML